MIINGGVRPVNRDTRKLEGSCARMFTIPNSAWKKKKKRIKHQVVSIHPRCPLQKMTNAHKHASRSTGYLQPQRQQEIKCSALHIIRFRTQILQSFLCVLLRLIAHTGIVNSGLVAADNVAYYPSMSAFNSLSSIDPAPPSTWVKEKKSKKRRDLTEILSLSVDMPVGSHLRVRRFGIGSELLKNLLRALLGLVGGVRVVHVRLVAADDVSNILAMDRHSDLVEKIGSSC